MPTASVAVAIKVLSPNETHRIEHIAQPVFGQLE